MKSLRDTIAAAVAETSADAGTTGVAAIDVFTASGVRADHQLPEPDGTTATKSTDPGDPRYLLGNRLGEGGMGVVDQARDRNLGRDVAIKSIPAGRLDRHRLARFVAEARITAQLDHPGIVPVHDLFVSPSGDVHYSMKRVSGAGLDEILNGLAEGDPRTVERHNLIRLLNIFLSAAHAVAYAHKRRVIHRDLKPANIMVGDHREVLVMDWGVARLLDDRTAEPLDENPEPTGAGILQTADGVMVGSPAYMAPEQLELGPRAIGTAADVYALGIILYEILTLTRPYQATSVARLLYLAAKGEFPKPSLRSPGRDIPPDVEAICLKAMALNPLDRYPDASALTQDLETYLEGVGPRRKADLLVAEGREMHHDFRLRMKTVDELRTRVAELHAGLKPWDNLELKRRAWALESRLADAEAKEDRVFGDCEAAFESALSHVPNFRPAREGLAELYWLRFLQAEAERDTRSIRRWRELIRRYGGERFAERLEGAGHLSVETHPVRAHAMLYPLVEEDGRMVPGQERALGLLPAVRLEVAMGTYILELTGPDLATCRVPVVVDRSMNVALKPWMAPEANVRRGFVHIPGGPVDLGGDPAAISGRARQNASIGDFAIARYPVSVAQYVAFLNAIGRKDPAHAYEHLPRTRGGLGVRRDPLFDLQDDGTVKLPLVDRDGQEWRGEQPVVSITIHDARAYAVWASYHSDGPPLRLPTESEWEKAARGIDHRIFPWGNRFDAGFCVMAQSSPTPPRRCIIGQEPKDSSPYGVRDLGGGVRDWVEWDSDGEHIAGRAVLRGGSYGTVAIYCHCASRSVVEEYYVGSHVGFRLAHDLAD